MWSQSTSRRVGDARVRVTSNMLLFDIFYKSTPQDFFLLALVQYFINSTPFVAIAQTANA